MRSVTNDQPIEARMKDKDEMSKASNDKPQDPRWLADE